MYNNKHIQIDLDQLLYGLFCLYAFSMPFELFFEKLFYFKTIFKPFRILSLLIIVTYIFRVLRKGIELNPKEQGDVFIYLIFVYGVLVSCVQVVTNIFNANLFYSDLLLIGLNVLTFFVYKSIPLIRQQALKILQYFVAGILVNATYIFYSLFFKIEYGRQSGFIDNPNYAALGLVMILVYCILRSNYNQTKRNRLFGLVAIVFSIYIFIITGSRAGLAIFLLALFFLFLFASIRRKLFLFLISGLIVFQISTLDTDYFYLGGSMVLLNRVTQKMSSESEDVRFVIWRGVFRSLEDKGYWGMGIGQFKANFARYYGEESNKLVLEIVNRGYFLSTHNDYLAILADYGLPGLFCYITFLFVTIKRLWFRVLYPSEDENTRFLNQYSFIVLSCLIIFGIAAESFQHQLFWFIMMFSTKNYS